MMRNVEQTVALLTHRTKTESAEQGGDTGRMASDVSRFKFSMKKKLVHSSGKVLTVPWSMQLVDLFRNHSQIFAFLAFLMLMLEIYLLRSHVQTLEHLRYGGTADVSLSMSSSKTKTLRAMKRLAEGEGDDNGEVACSVSVGRYQGSRYSLPGITMDKRSCLLESKWLMVWHHTILWPPLASSIDGSEDSPRRQQTTKEQTSTGRDAKTRMQPSLIDDWLWIDYHDRINVLVEWPSGEKGDTDLRATTNANRQWLVFRQTKYALEGHNSLAVIGGIIEQDDESPEASARREVEEEAGVQCKKLEKLGRFRTDVNRGMGWIHGFLAMECSRINSVTEQKVSTDTTEQKQIGDADVERQVEVLMTTDEIRTALQKNQFLEVQWSNTVAMALLHLDTLELATKVAPR